MSGMWENIKAHPWITGLIVLSVFILVYILVGGSSAPAQSSGDNSYASEVAAATQLQEAQLAAQSQGNQINASLQAQQGQVQAAVTIAQLQAQADQNNTNQAAAVQLAAIQAQTTLGQAQIDAQNLQTTTNGQIAANYLTAQQNVASINAANQQNVYAMYFQNALQTQSQAYNQQLAVNAPLLSQQYLDVLANSGYNYNTFREVVEAANPNTYYSSPQTVGLYSQELHASGSGGTGVQTTTNPTPTQFQLPQLVTPTLQPLPFTQ